MIRVLTRIIVFCWPVKIGIGTLSEMSEISFRSVVFVVGLVVLGLAASDFSVSWRLARLTFVQIRDRIPGCDSTCRALVARFGKVYIEGGCSEIDGVPPCIFEN